MLASASNAVIIGFQVRPSMEARRLAESESIEIRIYSVIYDAIEEVKSSIEGMLAPWRKRRLLLLLRYAKFSRFPESEPSPAVW